MTNIILVSLHHVLIHNAVGVTDMVLAVPTPRTKQEDDQTNIDADGALVLRNRSASVPTIGTEETSIGG